MAEAGDRRRRHRVERRQPDLTLVTDFVNKQRNLSAIVRNCDAAGIMAIHAVLGEEDYAAGFSIQKGLNSGAHSEVILGLNEPGVIYFHETIGELLANQSD